MAVKVELLSQTKLPKSAEADVQAVLRSVPREHLRGLERIRLVDKISDPRVKTNSAALPGLYHPKQGAQPAWLEVATEVLLPPNSFFKRLVPRLSFKNNLAAVIISLVGQHYYLTLRHSIKRSQIEAAVRLYTERHLRVWHEQQHSLRARLFRPLQPTMEKWARALQKRAQAANKKK
jgi:hypothetical protein